MAKITKERTVKKIIFVSVGVNFNVRHYGKDGKTIH